MKVTGLPSRLNESTPRDLRCLVHGSRPHGTVDTRRLGNVVDLEGGDRVGERSAQVDRGLGRDVEGRVLRDAGTRNANGPLDNDGIAGVGVEAGDRLGSRAPLEEADVAGNETVVAPLGGAIDRQLGCRGGPVGDDGVGGVGVGESPPLLQDNRKNEMAINRVFAIFIIDNKDRNFLKKSKNIL